MKFPLFISKKFIASSKGSKFVSLISFISIGGVALGVFVLIIALTVLEGFEEAITKKIIDFDSHIKITAYQGKNLPSYKESETQIKNLIKPYENRIIPFLEKAVMISYKDNSEGIFLKGLRENDKNSISQYMVDGKYDVSEHNGKPSIVLGLKLAQFLNVKPGDKITVFSLRDNKLPDFNNPPAIMQLYVTGLFESGMAHYDDLIAYTNLKNLQDLTEAGESISGYDIKLNDITKIDTVVTKLTNSLRYPYYPKSLYKLYPNIFNWIDLQKLPVPLVLSLITLVACFNMVGTILMIVLEKTTHIGVLKSLGAKRKSIKQIFVSQGLYLSFIGIITGNLMALLFSYLQLEFNLISIPDSVYFISSIPISINPQNYIIVTSAAAVLCYLASYIPSYVASKMNPINLIRFK